MAASEASSSGLKRKYGVFRSEESSSGLKRKYDAFLSEASSSGFKWKHDVFLSFRGEDTRKNFTDYLYEALVSGGVAAYRDENELPRGKDISEELLQAIEVSKISVVVFSKNYASSRWCLAELVKIIECKNTRGQTVIPIFYDVDPSDVRKQAGSYAEAFAKHEERFKDEMEMIEKWRAALTEAGNLSGWDLANRYESRSIKDIVGEVRRILDRNMRLDVPTHPVALKSRVESVMEMLRIGSDEVRMVGIYGMSGIGKTTIAKAVYNMVCEGFDGCSFLLNIKDGTQQPGSLARMQEQLLSDILGWKDIKIHNADRGVNLIKERLCCRRVFIILDDMAESMQWRPLLSDQRSFGPGSRVLVTTRDERLLTELGVDERYKVEILNHKESIQLLSWHAFERPVPEKDYLQLSYRLVAHAQGLPLALQILGGSLFARSQPEWESFLEKLHKIPYHDIQKKLRISYDALGDDLLKTMFLDIACFFIGMDEDYVIAILEGCGFFPIYGIKVLLERSLIAIDPHTQKLQMHDLLRDMGREIVREESPSNPGNRSRLWFHQDVLYVLTKDKGTETLEGLSLDLPALQDVDGTEAAEGLSLDVPALRYVDVSTEAFAKMINLRLLKINSVHFTADSYEKLSEELRWLCWHRCPLRVLPPNLHLDNLVVLDLSYSVHLEETPNFARLSSLKRLELEGCTGLVEVDQSIGLLEKLEFLNLAQCKNIRELPDSICYLRSLETINLHGCLTLCNLPRHLGELKSLKKLDLSASAIKKLPTSTGHLERLEFLNLALCKNIRKLPGSICSLGSLETIELHGCLTLCSLPKHLGKLKSLKKLDLSASAIKKLPTSTGHLEGLEFLDLALCKNIRKLPSSICSLRSLATVNLRGCSKLCSLPVHLGELESLKKLVVSESAIAELPTSIRHLERLEFLDLARCKNIRELPNSICSLRSLETVFLQDCSKLCSLPEHLGELEALRSIHLTGSAITELPSSIGHLERLKFLDLAQCKNIRELPDSICNLRSLETVYLNGCSKLCSLPVDLGELEALRGIYLRGSAIIELPSSIGHLERLEFLDLAQCKNIRELPNSICNLRSLETMNLHGCSKLSSLPVHLGKLEYLKELVVSESAITKLPTSIGNLEKLELLDLALCKNIRELPDSICNQRFLKTMNLHECSKLCSLPEHLGELKALREIYISGSAITQLPTSIGHLERLEFLDLAQCKKIRELPDSICNLRSLETVNLHGCSKLCSLPKHLGRLKSLKKLVLSESAITKLPTSIGHLQNLKFLELKQCKKIKELPDSICKLRSLEIMNLHGCSKLCSLPEDLDKLESLKELILSESAIRKLPTSIVLLKNLEHLSLARQGVELLATFPRLSRLTELNLSECNLSDQKISIDFGSFPRLRGLHLEGNIFSSLPAGISNHPSITGLYLNNCKNLRSISDLPKDLLRLEAKQCTSIERYPNLSNIVDRAHTICITNCRQVIDIQGWNFRSHARGLAVLSTVPDWYQPEKRFNCKWKYLEACFPAREVPDWFDYKEVGSSVVFCTPSVPTGQKRAMIVCAIYSFNEECLDESISPASLTISFKNKTKGCETLDMSSTDSFDGIVCQDHAWVSYMTPDIFRKRRHSDDDEIINAEQGDEIEVSIEPQGGILVKKCGIHLPIDGDNWR